MTNGSAVHVDVTPVSYAFKPGMTEQEWLEIGAGLGHRGRSINWYKGDWLLFGEHNFGEKFAQAADVLGDKPATLVVMQWVAKAFKPNQRHENVSWTLHRMVARMPSGERGKLLKKIDTEKLSMGQVRECMIEGGHLPEKQVQSALQRFEGIWEKASNGQRRKIAKIVHAWETEDVKQQRAAAKKPKKGKVLDMAKARRKSRDAKKA